MWAAEDLRKPLWVNSVTVKHLEGQPRNLCWGKEAPQSAPRPWSPGNRPPEEPGTLVRETRDP